MRVMITGSTSPISVAHMWYADRIGEAFEVEIDPKYDDLYKTVEPIHKEHQGHIYKTDCILVFESLPQAINSTEPHSVAEAES